MRNTRFAFYNTDSPRNSDDESKRANSPKKKRNDRFNKFCLVVVKKFHHVQRLFVKIGSAKEIENVDRKWEEHKVKHFKRRKNAQSIISTMLIANARCGLFKRL